MPRGSRRLHDYAAENRRLRTILLALARAGVGAGALVEVEADRHGVRVVVCRADVDEAAFAADVRAAIDRLTAVFGEVRSGMTRTGVTGGAAGAREST